MTAELNEAEAFRVLRDGVHDDLGVVATRVILLESGQQDLIVDIGVKVTHIDLRVAITRTSSSALGSFATWASEWLSRRTSSAWSTMERCRLRTWSTHKGRLWPCATIHTTTWFRRVHGPVRTWTSWTSWTSWANWTHRALALHRCTPISVLVVSTRAV